MMLHTAAPQMLAGGLTWRLKAISAELILSRGRAEKRKEKKSKVKQEHFYKKTHEILRQHLHFENIIFTPKVFAQVF